MSKQTLQAVTDAIAEHCADEYGTMLGAWMVICDSPDMEEIDEGANCTTMVTDSGRFTLMHRGLLEEARDLYRRRPEASEEE